MRGFAKPDDADCAPSPSAGTTADAWPTTMTADHCFIVRSSSVHRIQEVQMTLYHVLTELVQRTFAGETACA